MNLFINGVSSLGVFIIFDGKRNILSKKDFKILGNESSLLLPKLDDFLKENNYNYFDIENIVVVNGPGSFTGIRTIVLLVNTINYIIGKKITKLSFFDLFDSYPIIKSSSKRDCFIQKSKDSPIEILKNEELVSFLKTNNISKVNGDFNIDFLDGVKIFDKIDYLSIIKKVKLQDNKLIKAFYIKKPNIS